MREILLRCSLYIPSFLSSFFFSSFFSLSFFCRFLEGMISLNLICQFGNLTNVVFSSLYIYVEYFKIFEENSSKFAKKVLYRDILSNITVHSNLIYTRI